MSWCSLSIRARLRVRVEESLISNYIYQAWMRKIKSLDKKKLKKSQTLSPTSQQTEEELPKATHPRISTRILEDPKAVLQFRYEVRISISILIYFEEKSLECLI